MSQCSVPDCESPALCRDLCNKHYLRFRKSGTLVANARGTYGFQKGDANYACKPEARVATSIRRRGSVTPKKIKKKISTSMRRALKDPALLKKWSERSRFRRPLSQESKEKARRSRAANKKRSTVLHEADAAFSKYIRYKASNNGFIRCFTCDLVKPIEEIDCGHFVSRRHMNTRFMERNVEPQCRSCNRFHEGMKDVFALRLVDKYGHAILAELYAAKHVELHLTKADLEEIRDRYKAKRLNLETST